MFLFSPDEVVLVTPSDHLIKDTKAYFEAVERAKLLAEENNLVTFGIKPEYPETGFGYIECVVSSEQLVGYNVEKFHKKPDIATAKKYLEQNTINYSLPTTNYFWNSGMFCFKRVSF